MSSTAHLPPGGSPDLHLVEATPEELLAQQHAHFVAWGGALSREAYLRREKLLFAQELTRDGALTQWVLVYQPRGSTTRQVVCGCESVKKPALVRRPDGKVEDVIAYGIASVFCPEQFRGKGYAGRMMSEINSRLRSWHTAPGKETLFSVLFSDIGKQFYAARGWENFPSAHVALPVAADSNATSADLATIRSLHAEDLAEFCELDEQLLRRRMARAGPAAGKSTAVALIPQQNVIEWHHAREEFIADELFRRKPDVKGAVVGEAGSRVWCYWTRVWTNPQEKASDTLHILRLGFEDEAFEDFAPASEESVAALLQQESEGGDASSSSTVRSVAALFAAAKAQAVEWKMDEVWLWNPSSSSVAAARLLDGSVQVEHRDEESIASLLWYGEGSHEGVEWMCNEKFGWC